MSQMKPFPKNKRMVLFFEYECFHGVILRTGVLCKKSLVICATQLVGGVFFKKTKYVKHFWIFAGVRKSRVLIGLCK